MARVRQMAEQLPGRQHPARLDPEAPFDDLDARQRRQRGASRRSASSPGFDHMAALRAIASEDINGPDVVDNHRIDLMGKGIDQNPPRWRFQKNEAMPKSSLQQPQARECGCIGKTDDGPCADRHDRRPRH